MKLSVWAKSQGISYKTAWRLWKTGNLPVPAKQLATGTVIIQTASEMQGVALYARVSSSDQRADLDRQLSRLTEYAVLQKWAIVDAVREVGSGLNGSRKGMLRLLGNQAVRTIVVEHRDRLMRFGFEYVQATLEAQGRQIVVIEPDEVADKAMEALKQD